MIADKWQESLGLTTAEDKVWELYHENSKVTRYNNFPSDETLTAQMRLMAESIALPSYPAFELPKSLLPLDKPIGEAMLARSSARAMAPCDLTLEQTASIFGHAYGITRDQRSMGFPRPFRACPSAGGLYPLELYFDTEHVIGLPAGLYHFNPEKLRLQQLYCGGRKDVLAKAVVQPSAVEASALVYFITAVFDRTIFKYGDRGYRFVHIEAGHVAQNINLAATALGLGCLNIGGFYDREIDELLGLDGLSHSTIYMGVIGQSSKTTTP